ncbi:hypothetical protein DFH06DRAFT_1307335 [Mycena polygramma]|nr:hypothetical protein DFH06DRAFT_1307335 [Mycena polygramma]
MGQNFPLVTPLFFFPFWASFLMRHCQSRRTSVSRSTIENLSIGLFPFILVPVRPHEFSPLLLLLRPARVNTFHFFYLLCSDRVWGTYRGSLPPSKQILVLSQTCSLMARRFVDADFRNLKRSDLVTLVERQVAKWPTSKGKFLRHKTNIPDMKWALINSEFTTELPLPTAAPIPLPLSEPASIALPPTAQHEHGPSSEVLSNTEAQGSLEPSSGPVQESIERRSILLLIEDARSVFKDKISKRITVPVVNRENCKPGEWRARPRDVMNALQDSISFLDGPAKIGIAEEEAPEYTMYFGTIVGHLYCDDPELDSYLLLIPCDNKLNITANFIGVWFMLPSNFRFLIVCQGPKLPLAEKRVQSEIRTLPDPIAKLEESSNIGASSAQTSGKRKREPLTEDREAVFLTKRVNETDAAGFSTFQKNHNQRLSLQVTYS